MATSGRQLDDGNPLGTCLGQSTASLIGFYGLTTPIAQPSGAAQNLVTDTSGGTANSTTGITTITGTYNSTILANAIATLAAQTNALQAALKNLNLIKGSA